MVDVFNSFDVPDFVRETEFVSLAADGSYPWIGGDLLSTDGVRKPEDDYLAMTTEYVTDDNTSKWCKLSRRSMAVGAPARFNNNFAALHPETKKVAEALGLAPVCHNPYPFNATQIVECAHVVHESLAMIGELRDATGPLKSDFSPQAGQGVGAVEVPRGILYHDYEYGDDGRVVKANCVIPTSQNHANIHHDIETLAALHAARGTGDAEIERLCSMLVGAYDPCISCSVH